MSNNKPARNPEQTLLDLMLAAQLYRGRKGTGKGNRRALKALALKVRRAN